MKKHIMILDDKQKNRLTILGNEVIDLIEKKTNGIEEQAFLLRVLMESFEESQNCVVPFNKRHTEPTHIYDKGGVE